MINPRIKKVVAHRDRPKARDFNTLVATVKSLVRSFHSDGIMDSTGFHTRVKRPITPPDVTKITIENNSPYNFQAYRFVQLTAYDITTKVFSATLVYQKEYNLAQPSLAEMAVIEEQILMGNQGTGYIGGIHRVLIYGDYVNEGDSVGAIGKGETHNGKAILGGPFVCIEKEFEDPYYYAWVMRNGS